VVRLDRRCWSFEARGFDNVGIQGPLKKIAILREVQSLHSGFELLDEKPADDLPLLLRLRYVLQLGIECIRRINDFEFEPVDFFLQSALDLFSLLFPQQSGIDHERVKALPKGSVN